MLLVCFCLLLKSKADYPSYSSCSAKPVVNYSTHSAIIPQLVLAAYTHSFYQKLTSATQAQRLDSQFVPSAGIMRSVNLSAQPAAYQEL